MHCYFYNTVLDGVQDRTNDIDLVFVTFTKSSRERGLAHPGGGFGRMVRSS